LSGLIDVEVLRTAPAQRSAYPYDAERSGLLMAVETRAFLAMGADLSCWLPRAIRG